jgi:hypothetical protein
MRIAFMTHEKPKLPSKLLLYGREGAPS